MTVLTRANLNQLNGGRAVSIVLIRTVMNTDADDKIKVSEESTCVSKYHHNALIPISRLPLEILTKIFLLLPPSAWDDEEPKTIYIPEGGEEGGEEKMCFYIPEGGEEGGEEKMCFIVPRGYLAWLRFTHVCHRWREIALSYPLLWNYVNFSKLAMTCSGKDSTLTSQGQSQHVALPIH